MHMDRRPSDPIFPLEIFQRIIKDVSDMALVLKLSDLRMLTRPFDSIHTAKEPIPQEIWRTWQQTMLSLSLVCISFAGICQPYLMRMIEVTTRDDSESQCIWAPLAFKNALQGDSGPSLKVLEQVHGLSYRRRGYSTTKELALCGDETLPPVHLLLSLPSLQMLHIDGNFYEFSETDHSCTVLRVGILTLLQCYAFGRPEGFFVDREDLDNPISRSLSSRYCGWAIPISLTSPLTHIVLSRIQNLPLVHLLTSSTLISIELYFCTIEWEEYSLFLSDDGSTPNSGGFITLKPTERIPELNSSATQPRPGFRVKSWRAVGPKDITPALLQYCTLLERLDVALEGGDDSLAPANHWRPQSPVQIIQETALPSRVALPILMPFQNLQQLRYGPSLDWAYFCNVAEKAGNAAKLLPNLKELTLDRTDRDQGNEGTDSHSGPERVLIRHVDKLEVLKVTRGHPYAFDLAKALLVSSNSLRELHLGWKPQRYSWYNNLPRDICEKTLCNALDAIKGVNRIKVLDVDVEYADIRVDLNVVSLPLEAELHQDSNIGAQDDHVPTSQWTRLSALLTSNPASDFPFLKRINLTIKLGVVLEDDYVTFVGREDQDIDLIWPLQRSLSALLGLDSRGEDSDRLGASMNVKCQVTVATHNFLNETRTNLFELTRMAAVNVSTTIVNEGQDEDTTLYEKHHG